MINKHAGSFGITLAAVFSLVMCSSVRAQFSYVAYDGFNFGAGILAGQHGNAVRANDGLSSGCFGLNTPQAINSGWTLGGVPVSQVPVQSIGILAHNPANASGATGAADSVPGPTYASLGIIGAALVCGWLWKKPERRN